MKKLVTYITSLLLCISLFAQSDSLPERTKWYKPDYAKFQFAGEVGLFSTGIGSKLFKKQNGELDLFVGYLPESIGGDEIITSGIKFQYLPWDIPMLNNKINWHPLTMGVILFHAWGEDLNRIKDKDLYPQGYYWWSLGTRFGPVVGTRIRKDFAPAARVKSLAFYMEFVTNDLYIYSWGVNDDIIPLWAIFDMSLGLRIEW